MNTSRGARMVRSGGAASPPDSCTQCGRPIPPGRFLHHLRYDCVATGLDSSSRSQKSEVIGDPAKQRCDEIRQICEARGIREVVHFTRIEVLSSILKEGLLSRKTLERLHRENDKFFIPVDRYRFDDRFDMISLSIGFPNHLMFGPRVERSKDKWVVLLLERSLLWELDCAFFPNNAARRTMREQSLVVRRRPESLEETFAEQVETKEGIVQRCDHGLPDWYPTDPQAEVLVDTAVPARYIAGVAFISWAQQRAWLQRYVHDWPDVLLTVQPYLFEARPSWDRLRG